MRASVKQRVEGSGNGAVGPGFFIFYRKRSRITCVDRLHSRCHTPVRVVPEGDSSGVSIQCVRGYGQRCIMAGGSGAFLVFSLSISKVLRRLLDVPSTVLVISGPYVRL